MRGLLFILSTFAIVACSNSDEGVVYDNNLGDSDDIINLNISTSTINSKASLIESATDMSSLALYCELHTDSESWSTSAEFTHANNKQVVYDPSTDEWSYDGEALYWAWDSPNDKYSFRSYSPYATADNGISPSIYEGELAVGFKVQSDIEEQIDLMMATPITDMYRPAGTQITLEFNHVLSALSFELVGDYESVKNITIKNLYSEGVATYNTSGMVEWSYTGDKSTDFTITRAQTESDEYMLMIPQEVTHSVEFVVNLEDDSSEVLTTSVTLEANYKYAFTIYVGDEIAFGGIQVEPWVDASLLGDSGGGGGTSVYVASPRPVDFTANCYMIHPSDGYGSYYIDVNSQINYFWDKSNGYVTENFSDYLITQDDIDAITADNINGTSTSALTVETLWDTTGNTIACKLTTSEFAMKESVTALSAPDFTTSNCTVALKLYVGGTNEGNILVAVKRNGVILWSWHFWVTEYNPDLIAFESTPTDGQYEYTYSDQSGAVHRYKDADGTLLWGEGGAYESKFIMDRDLGAISTLGYDEDNTLLYQFGRKDPFPVSGITNGYTTAQDVYSTDDSKLKNFSDAVNEPTSFYWFSQTSPESATYETNWSKQNTGDEYLWNDYYLLLIDYNEKSLFDPSPLGWQMISENTCTDFSTSTFRKSSSIDNMYYYVPNYPSFVPLINFHYNGLHSYDDNTPNTWYFENFGFLRCSKPNGVGNSYYMSWSSLTTDGLGVSSSLNDNGFSRSHGLATRVIQYTPEN